MATSMELLQQGERFRILIQLSFQKPEFRIALNLRYRTRCRSGTGWSRGGGN
jgi:hypothetical protein